MSVKYEIGSVGFVPGLGPFVVTSKPKMSLIDAKAAAMAKLLADRSKVQGSAAGLPGLTGSPLGALAQQNSPTMLGTSLLQQPSSDPVMAMSQFVDVTFLHPAGDFRKNLSTEQRGVQRNFTKEEVEEAVKIAFQPQEPMDREDLIINGKKWLMAEDLNTFGRIIAYTTGHQDDPKLKVLRDHAVIMLAAAEEANNIQVNRDPRKGKINIKMDMTRALARMEQRMPSPDSIITPLLEQIPLTPKEEALNSLVEKFSNAVTDKEYKELACLMDIFNGPAKEFSFKRKCVILNELFGRNADPEEDKKAVESVVTIINDVDDDKFKEKKYTNLAKNSIGELSKAIQDVFIAEDHDVDIWNADDYERLRGRVIDRYLELNL